MLATWKAESTTRGIRTDGTTEESGPPGTTYPTCIQRSWRGAGTRRLPRLQLSCPVSGSFENWALGPGPHSGKEWGGASGKAVALAELGLAGRP